MGYQNGEAEEVNAAENEAILKCAVVIEVK